MMRPSLSAVAITACLWSLAPPLPAADKPPVTATVPDAPTRPAMRAAWPPETISGLIALVDPVEKLLVIRTSDGIPYDMLLTPQTRIRSGDQMLSLQDLAGKTNQTVSVKFVPERRGDIAREIDLPQ
jgi:hypothetical protein